MTIGFQANRLPSDFLKRLRTQTSPFHTELEEAGLSSRLMDPGLTLETYKSILIAFYGFIIPVEKHYYSNSLTIFPHLALYKGESLLRQDLLFLGLSENNLNDLPQFMGMSLKKQSEEIGCLYVLEGSKLGGQMISRHVQNKLEFINGEGTKFFSAHVAKTGLYWKEFIDILSRYATDTMQEQEIIEGAKQTFSDFSKWLKTTN